MGFQYASSDSKNENVGDFALPERASRTQAHDYSIDLREISILSERTVHDVRFKVTRDHSERNPASTALTIIVKDAFTSGGAQNLTRNDTDTYELSNLIYFAGEKLTMRSGVQAWHRRLTSFSEDNFFGEFTFSDLASYRAGRPLKYRITCCDPLFRMSQSQLGLFSQNDLKLTRTFTLMLGARYQIQTNIRDRNNFDPRIGFAYAIGNSTVIRGGSGIFSDYLADSEVLAYTRVDGNVFTRFKSIIPGGRIPSQQEA
jgi:outer membrane receptor protein involved in Fe transport